MKSADGRFEYQDKDGDPLPEGSPISAVGRLAYECRSDEKGLLLGLRGHCSINIRNAGYVIPQRNWSLTGTLEEPTIAPSINCGDCKWHGFIREGVFFNSSEVREARQ